MPTPPIVIVGTGLAGYTLAREFRKLDPDTPLTIISRDAGGFYSKPMLSNALAANKSAAALVTRTATQMAEELRVEMLTHTAVADIDPAGGLIWLSDGRPLAFQKLVLAWGADPVRLPLAGGGAENVVSVNDVDDFARFSERLASARRVAILGAGLIGCEFANDLLSRNIEPIVIDPAEWPLSRLLPAAAGQYLAGALGKAGVDFRWRVSAQAVDRVGHGFSVALSDHSRIEADLVLSAVGLRPRTEVAARAGVACNRGIVTDRHLETSRPNVYALGDCAEVAGLNLPFVLPLMQQARALARTLAGVPTEVAYPVMPVVVKTPACPTVV
ncbi:MAG: NAD(P)/FAD-dependent oxidoreductase, partial [Actinomycetota bacterium]